MRGRHAKPKPYMALFEVFIPGKESGMPNVTLTVDAQNWIGALRSGLKSIGEGQDAIANVMCDIKEDNSIHVTDVATRRVFRLRELPAKASAPASSPVALDAKGDPQTMPEGPRPISMDGPTHLDASAATSAPESEETIKNVRPSDFESLPRTLIEFPVPKAPPGSPPLTPSIAPAQSGATSPFTSAPGVQLPQADSSVAWTKMASPSAELKLPAADSSVAWTKMPGPSSSPSPAAAPPHPAPAAPPPAVAPPPAAAPAAAPPPVAPSAAAASASAPTIEIPRADLPRIAPAPITAPVAASSTSSPVSPVSTSSPGMPKAKTIPPTPRGVPAPAPKRPSGQFASAAEPKSREVTAPQPTDPRIGRAPTASQAAAPKGATPIDVQDAIAAVFDATQDLYMETSLSAQHVADTLLDIALKHIPAEAGTFYIADVNGHELEFAAVRGPKAEALKKSGAVVKVGQGIIGFCAQEGVCLVVSDIQKDPRYYAAIANKIDYQPKDTLCASAEKDGRLWGAVQLINSKGGFEAAHMEVLRFIGLTAAAMLERIDDRG